MWTRLGLALKPTPKTPNLIRPNHPPRNQRRTRPPPSLPNAPLVSGLSIPSHSRGQELPFFTDDGTLSIPFISPDCYHCWKGGRFFARLRFTLVVGGAETRGAFPLQRSKPAAEIREALEAARERNFRHIAVGFDQGTTDLSSSVPSSSPVVAAVCLALARSLWLGAGIAPPQGSLRAIILARRCREFRRSQHDSGVTHNSAASSAPPECLQPLDQ